MHAEGVQGSILVTKVTHTRTRDERATAHQVALLFVLLFEGFGTKQVPPWIDQNSDRRASPTYVPHSILTSHPGTGREERRALRTCR